MSHESEQAFPEVSQHRATAIFDAHDVLAAMRARPIMVAVIAFLGLVAATTIAFMMTPVFRAEVLVGPAEENNTAVLSEIAGSFGSLAGLAGATLGAGKSDEEVSLATLSSYAFTSKFISENGLLPELFSKKWNKQRQRWKADNPKQIPTMADAVRKFDREVRSITRDRRTGMIRIAIEWHDRQKAAEWANELVRRVNEMMRLQAIAEAEKSIKYLGQELAKTSIVEVQQRIHKLIESQINRITLASARDEFAFKVIDPAVVPDPKYKVRPKRLRIMFLGLIGGSAAGVVTVVVLHLRSRKRPHLHAARVEVR